MRDERAYLLHVLECIDAIRDYVSQGRRQFMNDRKTQKAVLRELQELSESTQRLGQATKTGHREIPWHDIAGFRNVLVHNYLGLDYSRVWDIVERDLPPLRNAIEAILKEHKQENRDD